MKSSFKGVQFHLESVHNSFDNQINIYEIPGKDKVITENLGQISSTYPVEAYVIGSDSELVRDQLISACRSRTPGILYIPSLGMIRTYCKKISIKENFSEKGLIRFSMEFIEATDEESAIPYVDKIARLMQKAKNLKEEYVGKLIEAMSLIDMPTQILDAAFNTILQVMRLSHSSSAFGKGDSLNILKKIKNFTDSVTEIISKVSNEEILNLGIANNSLPIELLNFVDAAIFERLAISLINGEKLTKRQMEKAIDMANSLYSTATNKIEIKNILDMMNDYPFLKTTTVTPTCEIPSILAIYRGGGDLNKDARFLRHNNIINPLSISSSVEVFVD